METPKIVTMVWVKTQFVGFHRWLAAPDEVVFLRDWHRHVFHVKMGVQVTHPDREQEFFILQRKLNQFIDKTWIGNTGGHFEASCEMIAASIQQAFDALMVEVSEDGENGATVYKLIEVKRKPQDLF